MVTSNGTPYKNYLEAQVEAAGPEKLLLLVYRAAINRCGEARKALARSDRGRRTPA
ncbi:flagellar protein FliS [bacterium]|nr:flagellar protein FliS [bacterium]